MTTAKTGDTVAIDFEVRTNDGRIVGGTKESGPQTLKIGDSQIYPQIEQTLDGMAVGTEESVTVPSANAFGPRRDDLVIDIARTNLPPEPVPQRRPSPPWRALPPTRRSSRPNRSRGRRR